MDKIIRQTTRLFCNPHQAFEMFTANASLQSWLTELAEVEPVVGGKYELFWHPSDRENDSTIGCKVTAIEPDQFLAFEWKGPRHFKHFMNDADPLTHVVVFFVPCVEATTSCTDVHIIHSGWRSTSDWEEARQWFDKAWSAALEKLARLVNGEC